MKSCCGIMDKKDKLLIDKIKEQLVALNFTDIEDKSSVYEDPYLCTTIMGYFQKK